MIKLLFLVFSGLKFSKILFSVGTMLLSVLVYAGFYGWRYALGFVLLLLVHEGGHYVAARQRGLNVGLPTFVPFVGAWIALKEQPHDAEMEAYVGIAGPLAGSIGALICYWLARQTDSNLLLALSYSGFLLNLFNLIPLSPFDGGRITAALSPKLWFLGVPVLIGLFIYRPSPMLIVMALLAAPQLMKAWKMQTAPSPDDAVYYQVPAASRINYACAYIALLAFLALMTHGVHDMLESLRTTL